MVMANAGTGCGQPQSKLTASPRNLSRTSSFRVAEYAKRAASQDASKFSPAIRSSGAPAFAKDVRISVAILKSSLLPLEESFRVRNPFSFGANFNNPGPIACVPLTSSSCKNDRLGGGGGARGQYPHVDGSTKARKNSSQAFAGTLGLFASLIDSARAVPPHQIRASPFRSPSRSLPFNLQFEKFTRDINGCAFIAHATPIISPKSVSTDDSKFTSLNVTLYNSACPKALRKRDLFLLSFLYPESVSLRSTKLNERARNPASIRTSGIIPTWFFAFTLAFVGLAFDNFNASFTKSISFGPTFNKNRGCFPCIVVSRCCSKTHLATASRPPFFNTFPSDTLRWTQNANAAAYTAAENPPSFPIHSAYVSLTIGGSSSCWE
mmetsp:Transcript_34718/g.66019  ORF Transcript_34718/g.66019 Transcript_34718/m.66019 type:complete len:379 (+) Transcript_34718:3294-4430(+)